MYTVQYIRGAIVDFWGFLPGDARIMLLLLCVQMANKSPHGLCYWRMASTEGMFQANRCPDLAG